MSDAYLLGVIDPKLLHLVRKLTADNGAAAITANDDKYDVDAAQYCDSIVQLLRTRHREYQRKDVVKLTAAVDAAIQQIIGANISSNSKKKRKQEEEEEAEYDRAAAERDTVVAGGGLNASLRNRYKQVSLDRSRTNEAASLTASATSIAATKAVLNGNGPPNGKSSRSASISPEDTTKRAADNPGSDDRVESEDAATFVQDANGGGSNPEQPPLPSSASADKPKKIKRIVRRRGNGGASSAGDGAYGGNGGGEPDLSLQSQAFMVPVPRPTERYADLGGMTDIIQTVRQLVEYPVTRPELYRHLGVDPPRGVLLRGPPGTGKTHLANAVAGQLGIPFFRVSAPELVSGMSGESESRIRDLFQAASDMAPSIIFLDEIDAVAPKRSDASGSRGMEKRMVAQLLTSMDKLAPENNRNQNAVLVLAATNRPDSLDPALRRAGRFDKEILLGVPDEDARERILRTMTKGMRLLGDSDLTTTTDRPFDYKLLARKTPGFVGADVKSLAKEAAVLAINRIFRDVLKDDSMHGGPNQENLDEVLYGDAGIIANVTTLSAEKLEPLYVTMDDFLAAIPLVQPSSQREGFATVPDVSWDDIGALQSIREELTISVLEPIRAPEKFKALGLQLPAGVLLYGPPGCGKTILAKAIARESGANFISVKGPELLDKYVGESERAVRLVFERARSSSPCIIFFDELDSLVPRRGSDGGGGGGVSERVVNQLLTEMDGLESRRSVFVIAATNRPELIDPAMMRPGRLDKLLYVPLPTSDERVSILRALANKVTLGNDVDLGKIGRSPRAEGYSGADCAALVREAGLAVLKEDIAAAASGMPADSIELRVMAKHFDAAFNSVMPSVSRRDQARYDKIRDRMARARSRGASGVEEEVADAAAGSTESVSDPPQSGMV